MPSLLVVSTGKFNFAAHSDCCFLATLSLGVGAAFCGGDSVSRCGGALAFCCCCELILNSGRSLGSSGFLTSLSSLPGRGFTVGGPRRYPCCARNRSDS